LRSAEGERPQDAWPDQSDDVYDPVADEMFSSKLPAKHDPRQFEQDLPARRREHISKVVETRKKFNLSEAARRADKGTRGCESAWLGTL